MSSIVLIDDLDDPRLNPYRRLKDRDLSREGNRFIAESEQVVRRLIAAGIRIDSLLIAEKRLDRVQDVLPNSAPSFVLTDHLIEQVIGFHFHSGVLACGFRPPAFELSDLIATLPSRATLMFLPDVNNTENLGTLMRVAASFGVAALLLGPKCCDPFYRQAVRVSMGAVFKLRIIRLSNALQAIDQLQAAGIECIATLLGNDAEEVSAMRRSQRSAILFGNESAGLSEEVAQRCNRRVTIPMDFETDSLNVAVAAGIVMHHLTRVAALVDRNH